MKTVTPNIQEAKIWLLVKKIQFKLAKYPFYAPAYRIASKFKNIFPKYHAHFSIKDFLKFHDEEFIRNAFRIILKREADSEAFNSYFGKLKNGELSKTEILGKLRYSREGKEKSIKIKGLLSRFLLQAPYRIPIIGYFLKLVMSTVNFPKTIRFSQNPTSLEKLSTEIAQLHQALDEIKKQTGALKLEIIDQQTRFTLWLEEARKRSSEPVSTEQIENMLTGENRFLDSLYVSFEDQFRGSRRDIKERQKIYLPYMKSVNGGTRDAPILDIGCGRGEWLELLKENGYFALGVDTNRIMVEQCKELNLSVSEFDFLEFLKIQKPESFGAVTGFHIIEHLPFKTLVRLIDESIRVLKHGGILILETPNPENILVGAYFFYSDFTHHKPLPPHSMDFLAKQRGLVNVEIKRLHKYLNIKDNDPFKKWFCSEMDYAVIGYKE